MIPAFCIWHFWIFWCHNHISHDTRNVLRFNTQASLTPSFTLPPPGPIVFKHLHVVCLHSCPWYCNSFSFIHCLSLKFFGHLSFILTFSLLLLLPTHSTVFSPPFVEVFHFLPSMLFLIKDLSILTMKNFCSALMCHNLNSNEAGQMSAVFWLVPPDNPKCFEKTQLLIIYTNVDQLVPNKDWSECIQNNGV